MTFMIYRERMGYERGLEQGLEQGLERGSLQNARENVVELLQVRFGELPETLVEAIMVLDERPRLKTLLKTAITIDSVAAFEQLMAKQEQPQILN